MALISPVRRRRALLALLLLLFAGSVRAAAAAADADPASDVLLVQNAFFPYQPTTPPALTKAVDQALTEIHATGLQLKVAIIGSRVDLGGIPELFGQVARYGKFLETEISFRGPQPLLVVMPGGLSLQAAGSPSALKGITPPAHQQSAGLARTALLAIERIAAARGRPIVAPSLDAGTGGGGAGALVIAIAVALVLIVAGSLIWRRTRQRSRRGVAT
jgi:hypothetical protein